MRNTFKCQKKQKDGRGKTVGKIIMDQTEERAELFFYGDIVSDSWASFWYEEDKCPQDIADFLGTLPTDKPVDIYINSGGGAVHAGLAIYHQLRRHEGYKKVHVDGMAASIASVIAMAGDEIIIPDAAQLMIHKPWSAVAGNADDMRRQADAMDVCQKSIVSVYLEHAKEGVTEADIVEMVNRETWFTGSQAEKYFNVQVETGGEVLNCASELFDQYDRVPDAEEKKFDLDMIADRVAGKIAQKLEKALGISDLEKEKQVILEELELM